MGLITASHLAAVSLLRLAAQMNFYAEYLLNHLWYAQEHDCRTSILSEV